MAQRESAILQRPLLVAHAFSRTVSEQLGENFTLKERRVLQRSEVKRIWVLLCPRGHLQLLDYLELLDSEEPLVVTELIARGGSLSHPFVYLLGDVLSFDIVRPLCSPLVRCDLPCYILGSRGGATLRC